MPPSAVPLTPNLTSFLRGVSQDPVEHCIETLIALLKRRQIRGPKHCAVATAYLLRKLISHTRGSDPARLIQRVRDVGKRLVAAQPRELAVGNIVRRILGLIRDEEDEKNGEGDLSGLSSAANSEPPTPFSESMVAPFSNPSHAILPPRDRQKSPSPTRPPLISSHTGTTGRTVTSMFSIVDPTIKTSGSSTPVQNGQGTHVHPASTLGANSDLRAEIMEGISEIIDELDQCEDQIASYGPDHIHASETIFTYSSSMTVQRFLLKAASKRKFTVIHAEAYPNNHHRTHALLTGNFDPDSEEEQMTAESFQKPLTAAGITVIMVPDSAIFALMSQVNKCILGAQAVLANGSLLAAAGTNLVVKAARHHRVPVLVLCATYKMSPQYPYDPEELIEYGEVESVVSYQDVQMRDSVKLTNPLTDFVDVGDLDLFVTNLGGCATGHMYRIVRDQYREEDLEL